MNQEDKPDLLSGVKVLDFTHYLQGPACSQYLADMSADVIKIEPPNGAFERHWGGANTIRVGGLSAFFMAGNRNKRSLAIDLKHPDAKEVIFRLVKQADVVVQNFRPGVFERLGFGFDALRKVRPEIIYASASGYGPDGPYKNLPGQDLLAQAMSGLVAASGNYKENPVPAGVSLVDQHGGTLLALGILGAYIRRLRTGQGCRVDTSLLASGMDLQSESLALYFAGRHDRRVMERDGHLACWHIEAPYGIYQSKDSFLALSLNDPEKLAEALDSEELRSLKGVNCYEQRDLYASTVAKIVAARTFAELSEAFDKAGVWYGRVQDYDDLRNNPQVRHNRALIDVSVNGESTTLVAHPITYDGEVGRDFGFARMPGQNTVDVLEEAGFSSGEVHSLLAQEVVFSSTQAGEG